MVKSYSIYLDFKGTNSLHMHMIFQKHIPTVHLSTGQSVRSNFGLIVWPKDTQAHRTDWDRTANLLVSGRLSS